MSHKAIFAAKREQQLARLREATGMAERFTHIFACARQDREFQATFARLPPAPLYTFETVERIEGKPSIMDRLRGRSRQAQTRKVSAAEVDCDAMPCAYCGLSGIWTLCGRCHAFVCGTSPVGARFVCRPSCGASFNTVPLVEVEGQGGTSGGRPALGHAPARPLLLER